MQIQCLHTFLDGTQRFERDETRIVDDERGAYFVAQGWAKDLSGQATAGDTAAAETILDIQSGSIDAGDHHG